MSAVAPKPPASSGRTRLVPETWPRAVPDDRPPARAIPTLLAPFAIPLVWIIPRRLGPHLAASSWPAAYLAHLLGLILFIGNAAAYAMETSLQGSETGFADATLAEHLRCPFAGTALFLFSATSWPGAGIIALASIIAAHAALWLAAIGLAPWYAAGETRRRLYLRCVKLLLWGTSCAAVISLSLPWVVPFIEKYDRWLGEGLLPLALIAAWGMWAVSVVLRLGSRYAGPPHGPDWQPLTPRCERCGYSLTGLPLDGRCPECGEAVVESLPDHRRPSPYAAATSVMGRFRAFFRTAAALRNSRQFAKTTRVHVDRQDARRFARWCCLLAGLGLALSTLPIWLNVDPWRLARLRERMPGDVGVSVRIGLELLATTALASLSGVVLLSLLGPFILWRNPAPRSVMLCYSAFWLVPVACLGGAGATAFELWLDDSWYGPVFELPLWGMVTLDEITEFALMLPALAALGVWIWKLQTMLAAVRYANA